MHFSKLVDRAYARSSTPADTPVPVQALGEIYPRFGSRFRQEQAHALPVAVDSTRASIDLGIGSYFACEPEIIEAAIDSLRALNTRYLTLDRLQVAIATNLREEHGIDVDPSRQILLLGAARPGIALAVLGGVDSDDSVIVPDPDYIGLTHMGSAVGANVVRAPMRYQPDGSFCPDLDVIESLARAGARGILFTNPNNPTGHVWTRDELTAIAGFSDRYGTLVVVNEIYDRLVFRGRHQSYAAIGDLDRAVVIGGTAKAYEMTGFGIGWIISSATNIAVFSDLLFLTHQSKPSATSQFAALAALTSPLRDQAAANSRARLLENARLTVCALDGFSGCVCPLPDAGQFAFPRIGGNDLEAARLLKAQFQLQVVPGRVWGAQGAGHLRIALANEATCQIEGLERLRNGIAAYRKTAEARI
jgi:aspartate/methionine/tyrosine aminotransferase